MDLSGLTCHLLPIVYLLGCMMLGALLLRKPVPLANRLLAITILCGVVNQTIFTVLLVRGPFAFPALWGLVTPIGLLATTLLYLYICALIEPHFSWRECSKWLFLPLTVGSVWYLGGLFVVERTPQFFMYEGYLRTVLLTSCSSVYFYFSFRKFRRFEAQAKAVSSNVDVLRLSWLRFIFVIVFAFWVLGLADVFSGVEIEIWKWRPLLLTASLIFLTYVSLRYSKIFCDVEREGGESRKTFRLSDGEVARYATEVRALFDSEKLFRNPELRLRDIASRLKMKPYEVSEVLARGLHANFFDLVNRYRVEEAKRLLVSEEFAYMNILGIAMECGFNSKSSFAVAFQKFAGTTPSTFRRSHVSTGVSEPRA